MSVNTGSWRNRLTGPKSSSPSPGGHPSAPSSPKSETHARAAHAISVMAENAGNRVLSGLPGGEAIGGFMIKKMRAELEKLDESTLHQYLFMLEGMAKSIRTGENYQEMFVQ